MKLNGKRHYLGYHGTNESRARYDRLISEWLQNGRIVMAQPAEDFTVLELAARYCIFAREYYRKDGRTTDEHACIKSACKDLLVQFRNFKVRDFGPLELAEVRELMVAKGNSRKYINRQIWRLKNMFRWGASKSFFPAEIYHSLTTLQGLKAGKSRAKENRPVEPVDDRLLEATLAHMDPIAADMARFQRVTGCRPGEAMSLTPAQVDRSGELWVYRPKSHKTQTRGQSREVIIGPKGQEILAQYLLREPDSPCFERKNGEPYRKSHFRNAIRTAVRRAFPPPESIENMPTSTPEEQEAKRMAVAEWYKRHTWSPNQLRHSVATDVRKEFGLEAAQVVLGHSRADVSQIYAERDRTLAVRVMRSLG